LAYAPLVAVVAVFLSTISLLHPPRVSPTVKLHIIFFVQGLTLAHGAHFKASVTNPAAVPVGRTRSDTLIAN